MSRISLSIILLITFTFSGFCQAGRSKKQPAATAKKTAAISKECDCDYFPLCQTSISKKFDGLTWYGVKDIKGNTTYFRCANGIISKLWESWSTPVGYHEDYDPFTNTVYAIHTIGQDEYHVNKAELLRTNIPKGGGWKIPDVKETWEAGTISFFTVIDKDASLSYNDKTYHDVMQVRIVEKMINGYANFITLKLNILPKDAFFWNGEIYQSSSDLFYSKTQGFIKRENSIIELEAWLRTHATASETKATNDAIAQYEKDKWENDSYVRNSGMAMDFCLKWTGAWKLVKVKGVPVTAELDEYLEIYCYNSKPEVQIRKTTAKSPPFYYDAPSQSARVEVETFMTGPTRIYIKNYETNILFGNFSADGSIEAKQLVFGNNTYEFYSSKRLEFYKRKH